MGKAVTVPAWFWPCSGSSVVLTLFRSSVFLILFRSSVFLILFRSSVVLTLFRFQRGFDPVPSDDPLRLDSYLEKLKKGWRQ
jgi:hypothetical protein